MFKQSSDSCKRSLIDIGLLIQRVLLSCFMLFGHGLGKLQNFSARVDPFPDPLGIGANLSLGLTVFAEFCCSIFLVLGLFTRLATIPLLIAMSVAVFIVHKADPFSSKEKALLYLIGYLVILLTGPGRFSLDKLLFRSKKN